MELAGAMEAGELADSLLDSGPCRARPFGAGKFSQTYFVTDAGGDRFVLRVAPPDELLQLFYEYRMMRKEPAIHSRLLSETTVPVPEILAHDFSRKLVDRDFLIMPCLPGKPLSEAGLPGSPRGSGPMARAHRQWGGYVAQIHSITDPENRFGYLGENRCMEPEASWAAAFAVMYRKELDDVVSLGVYDEQVARDAMDLLEENLHAFEHCETSRLLHGDLWVTNLLVSSDGTVTGVLDFDRACWGDIEWDLAIANYCGVTSPAFWEGYGGRLDRDRGPAAVRRMFYLLYEHMKYIVISMSTRRNDPPRAGRYAVESLSIMERFRQTGKPGF